MHFKIKIIGRSCDGCSKCCEGWLSGEAYGYKFSPGLRCAFLNKGCSIYPNHPDDPCKSFECEWKSNRSLPEWLKPDKVNAIILKKYLEKHQYYMIVAAGSTIDTKVKKWANDFSLESLSNHIVVNNNGQFEIYSKNRQFKELADKKWNQGG